MAQKAVQIENPYQTANQCAQPAHELETEELTEEYTTTAKVIQILASCAATLCIVALMMLPGVHIQITKTMNRIVSSMPVMHTSAHSAEMQLPIGQLVRERAKLPEKTVSDHSPLTDSELVRLFEVLSKTESTLRFAIHEAGKRSGEHFTAILANYAAHSDYTIRVDALKAIAQPQHYETELGFSTILLLLADQDYLVRGFAAKVLGDIGDDRSLSAIRRRTPVERHPVVQLTLRRSLEKIVGGTDDNMQSQTNEITTTAAGKKPAKPAIAFPMQLASIK